MILGLAVALVLSQSPVKKVEIIRGNPAKKAAKTEAAKKVEPAGPTAEQQAREQQLEQKTIELDQRAEALKEKDAANEAKKERDAKARAAQAKALEQHARELQLEYERAANSLAGQE